MPRGVYTRRPRATKIVAPPEQEPHEIPEEEAATEAAFFVPDIPSCAMTEKKWRGQYPVWQCRKCRVETMDPGLATAARRACRK